MGDKKGRCRVIEGKSVRIVDPRTGKEAEGKIAGTKDKTLPYLINPRYVAELYHRQCWFNACDNAISDGVGGADAEVVYKNTDKTTQGDPEKVTKLNAFLKKDLRDFTTVGERLDALAKDYSIQGYMVIEIGRGADKIPAAWYHVPAVNIRELADHTGYIEVDGSNKEIGRYVKYQIGGHEDGARELMVIKKYDPSAKYMAATDTSALCSAADRLDAQDTFNSKLLKKGGLVPFILFLKEALEDDDFKRLEETVRQWETGEGDKMVVVLDGIQDGKLERAIADMNDASFVEGEKTLRERILAVKKVPPSKLGLPVANFSVAQIEDATFRFKVTAKILRLIFHRLNIVADEIVSDEGYDYEAKPETLIDFQTLAQALVGLVNNGTYNRNMALTKLGEPGMGSDGDKFTITSPTGVQELSQMLASGGTPTLGRMVDAINELRRMVIEAQRPGQDTQHD
jgi:hypothetical protein